MNRSHVVAYDPEWPLMFERVRSYVSPALQHLASGIEHVGSTAVPGLAARPVIDVCIVAASRDSIPACIERLAGIGYLHEGDLGVPGREAFRQPDSLPRHHLYLSPPDSLSPKNHLGFRDFLRLHPEAVREYGSLKAELARRFPIDLGGYLAGKSALVIRMLGESGMSEEECAEIRRTSGLEDR